MDRAAQLQRLKDGSASLARYADLVLQHAGPSHREGLLEPLRRHAREYAKLQLQLESATAALEATKDEMVTALSGGNEVDLSQLAVAVQRAAEHVAEEDVSRHDTVVALRRLEETAAPPAAAAQTPDGATDDAELQMTETQQTILDAWSKQPIVNPYRNQRCGHVYELRSLEQVLGGQQGGRQKNRRTKCPYTGCVNNVPLKWADLAEDLATRRAIEKNQGKK